MCLQLCKAGLKTLQDLGPEMRLALNEDMDVDEDEEVMMEDEEQEENATYKVFNKPTMVKKKQAGTRPARRGTEVKSHSCSPCVCRGKTGSDRRRTGEAPY